MHNAICMYKKVDLESLNKGIYICIKFIKHVSVHDMCMYKNSDIRDHAVNAFEILSQKTQCLRS